MKVTIEIDNEKSGTRDWTIIFTKMFRHPRGRTIITERTLFGGSAMYGLDELIKRIPATLKRRKSVDITEEVAEPESTNA